MMLRIYKNMVGGWIYIYIHILWLMMVEDCS